MSNETAPTHQYSTSTERIFGVAYIEGEPIVVDVLAGDAGYRFIGQAVPVEARIFIEELQ